MKTFKQISSCLLIAITLSLGSCYSSTFVVGDGPSQGVEETGKNHFFIFGLAQGKQQDTKAMAMGTEDYRINVEQSFVMVLSRSSPSVFTVRGRSLWQGDELDCFHCLNRIDKKRDDRVGHPIFFSLIPLVNRDNQEPSYHRYWMGGLPRQYMIASRTSSQAKRLWVFRVCDLHLFQHLLRYTVNHHS